MRVAYASRHDDENFGSRAERTLLVLAVAVGDLEGRPMPASKIAQYIGMPRATAMRKLDELQADGIVTRGHGKRFSIPGLDALPPKRLNAVLVMERHVHTASTELSKMDTSAIARQK